MILQHGSSTIPLSTSRLLVVCSGQGGIGRGGRYPPPPRDLLERGGGGEGGSRGGGQGVQGGAPAPLP